MVDNVYTVKMFYLEVPQIAAHDHLYVRLSLTVPALTVENPPLTVNTAKITFINKYFLSIKISHGFV